MSKEKKGKKRTVIDILGEELYEEYRDEIVGQIKISSIETLNDKGSQQEEKTKKGKGTRKSKKRRKSTIKQDFQSNVNEGNTFSEDLENK